MDPRDLALLLFSVFLIASFATGYDAIFGDPPGDGGGGEIGDGPGGDPGSNPITVDFTYSPANPDPGETVDFTDQSSSSEGSIVDWDWEFGNGESSNAQNPSTVYDDPGDYLVTLTVQDDQGNENSGSATIQVGDSSGDTIYCWNGEDDDSDGLADADDPGCVTPVGSDPVEGLIWESHISTTAEGESPGIERPAPYFSGSFTEIGNDVGSDRVSDSASGTGTSASYNHYYIQSEGSESSDDWGYGERVSTTISGFPVGTVSTGDRIVLPPNPDGSVNCGDGVENDAEPSGPDGQTGSGDVNGYSR